MTIDEVRERDGKPIRFNVEGKEGVGILNCSATEAKCQIVYGERQSSAQVSAVVDLTEAMIEAIEDEDGDLVLQWPEG